MLLRLIIEHDKLPSRPLFDIHEEKYRIDYSPAFSLERQCWLTTHATHERALFDRNNNNFIFFYDEMHLAFIY